LCAWGRVGFCVLPLRRTTPSLLACHCATHALSTRICLATQHCRAHILVLTRLLGPSLSSPQVAATQAQRCRRQKQGATTRTHSLPAAVCTQLLSAHKTVPSTDSRLARTRATQGTHGVTVACIKGQLDSCRRTQGATGASMGIARAHTHTHLSLPQAHTTAHHYACTHTHTPVLFLLMLPLTHVSMVQALRLQTNTPAWRAHTHSRAASTAS
jgi:hypothetical protein